jgi:hypothetical protein
MGAVTIDIFWHRGAIEVIFKLKSLHLVLIFACHHANINSVYMFIKTIHELLNKEGSRYSILFAMQLMKN